MCKRIILWISVLMAFCVHAVTETLNGTETINGIEWMYTVTEDNKAIVSSCWDLEVAQPISGAVTVPSEFGGRPVVAIGDYAFAECGLESVTIPDSVTSIGEGAFSLCSSLTSVTIPDSVTNIGDYAFAECGLESVTIPDSVTSIGEDAFSLCSSLTSVTIPDSVTNIGDYAFAECSSLTSVTIPDSVTRVGSYAFGDCSSLVEVTVPQCICVQYESEEYSYFQWVDVFSGCPISRLTIGSGVTNIGGGVFAYCDSLTSVTIPNSVTNIGDYAFAECGLESVTIPNSVTNIGDYAFEGCGLVSVTIPNSVTNIGDYAFAECGLESVTIPDSVTSIGECAFYLCSSLMSVTIPNSVTRVGSYAFGECSSLVEVTVPQCICVQYESEEYSYFQWADVFAGCPISRLTIGSGVTNIGGDVFAYCYSLTSVTIPNSVTNIGDYAFAGCGLESVTIPDSVTNIGDYAFAECSSLTSVTIPDSVTSIGECAFYLCSSLMSVTIPNSVTRVGFYAFGECSSLVEVTVPQCICVQYESEEYSYFQWWDVFAGCPISRLTIGSGVTNIGGDVFAYCDSLTSVTIPNSVTNIGDYAFAGCGLESVTIPDSVTNIGDYAFEWCGLESVTIPNSVTNIGDYAFAGCGLVSVTIPNSVTNIGDYAFAECGLESVTIPDSVTSIGEGAFSLCSSLMSVTIPNSVTNIGDYAFEGCGLESVTIPDSVTSIGECAFYLCSSLMSVTIPNSVTRVGSYAFGDCSSLVEVTVPQCICVQYESEEYSYFQWVDVFAGCPISRLTIGSGVTNIGGDVFAYCYSLTSVTIPNSVTNIGDYAFAGCCSLTSVTIPESVTRIGGFSFADCTSLADVTFDGDRSKIDMNIEDAFWDSLWLLNGGAYPKNDNFVNATTLTGKTGNVKATNRDATSESWDEECRFGSATVWWKWTAPADGSARFDTLDSKFDTILGVYMLEDGELIEVAYNDDCDESEYYESLVTFNAESGVMYYVIVGGYGNEKGDVVLNWEMMVTADPIPELDNSSTVDDVAAALEGSADAKLAANIKTVAEYAAYRTWALGLTSVTPDEVTASSFAWLSYALDADALIAVAPKEGDVLIDTFKSSANAGAFEFTVKIDGIEVGDNALEANIRKVFDIEGVEKLASGGAGFNSDNVEVNAVAPENGNIRFTVAPKMENGVKPNSFFFRVKMK